MEEQILKELEHIRKQGKGILYPDAVVEFATNEETALHPKFEWNNNIAGHEYRLWQARHLIKIVVITEPNTQEEVNVYVSLTTDREEGGYRALVDVLSNEDMRKQLLADAIRDLDYWQQKYQQIKELIPIFRAKEKVKQKLKL